MRKQHSRNTVKIDRVFNSVTDYYLHSDKVKGGRDSSCCGSYNFTKTDSFASALTLGRFGWPEGTRRVQDIRERIEGKLLTRITRQEMEHNVTGCTVDVGRYCDGIPDNMLEFTEEQGIGTRIIKIAFNAGYSGSTSEDQINTWGAAIVALVDAFEYAGTRVELDAIVDINGNGASNMRHTINVKRATDALDIDRVSFVAAHPSFLRRITFGVMEGESPEARSAFNINNGYGYCHECPAIDGVDVLIQDPGHNGQLREINRAIAWIEKTLKENGVEIE
jgi:hypothetical protein